MMNPFSLNVPERLPTQISPCPIVEASVEMRFTSGESWRNLPGLLGPRIRQRYPKENDLPLTQVPEAMRQQETGLLISRCSSTKEWILSFDSARAC